MSLAMDSSRLPIKMGCPVPPSMYNTTARAPSKTDSSSGHPPVTTTGSDTRFCLRKPARSMHPALYRSEEHTSELQSLRHLVCRLLLEKKKKTLPTTRLQPGDGRRHRCAGVTLHT